MNDLNNKIYLLLTYGTKDILFYFKKAFIVLALYTGWAIFLGGIRRIIIVGIVWILLSIMIIYIDKNKIVYIPPKPRKKVEKKQPEQKKSGAMSPKDFIMDVDESMFDLFTFNDYVVDTFKKQDANQIIDLMADRNKFVMEELKR